MSDVTRLVWLQLVQDTVDTSANNPCLLTLANRSPQRLQAVNQPPKLPLPTSGLFSATTVGAGGAAAGQAVLPVTSSANYRDGQTLWVGGTNPETVVIAKGGITDATHITLAANLGQTHAAGSLVTPLPTIITDAEPREVILAPDAYWRVVVGPEHPVRVPIPDVQAPVRLYESLLMVKVYDSSPSRALAESVRDRLDYLLNLGKAGGPNPANNGLNPTPLLGVAAATSPVWIEQMELVEGMDPHFDYSSLVLQVPLHFKVAYSQTYS